MPGELELLIKLQADVREFEQKLNRVAERFSRAFNRSHNDVIDRKLEQMKRFADGQARIWDEMMRNYEKVGKWRDKAEYYSRLQFQYRKEGITPELVDKILSDKMINIGDEFKRYMELYRKFSEQGYTQLAEYYKRVIEEKIGVERERKRKTFLEGVRERISGIDMMDIARSFGIRKEQIEKYGRIGEAIGGGRIGDFAKGLGILSLIAGILGAVLVVLNKIFQKASEFSGYGKATLRLLDVAFKLALKPIADIIGAVLTPILVWFIKNILVPYIKLWNRFLGKARKESKEWLVGGGILGGVAGGVAR